MTFLLDTNVLSEVRKPRPDAGIAAWFSQVAGEELWVSVLVVGEIRQGVERLRRRDAARADGIDTWLAALEAQFAERILPITAAIADRWGRMNVPHPLPVIDGLLGATALVHGLTVVTRDTQPLERAGVPYLNPWQRPGGAS